MPIAKISDGSWAVDGVPIYSPAEPAYDHEGLQSGDSGRAEDGYMIKEWVRTDVRNVELSYPYLTGQEKDWLLSLVQGRDFSFTYYDNGQQFISSAYCNKFSYKGYNRHRMADEGGVYKDVRFKIVEN